jgi:hypothetical protein
MIIGRIHGLETGPLAMVGGGGGAAEFFEADDESAAVSEQLFKFPQLFDAKVAA